MADPRWSTLGPFLWLRFRALGVPEPVVAVDRFLREEPSDDASSVLLSSTRYALANGRKPDPSALGAFCCNAAELAVVRAVQGESRLPIVLSVLDGLGADEISTLTGVSPTTVRMAVGSLDGPLSDAAKPLPEGSQPGDHPTTLDMLGFAAEQLPALRTEQIEQHVASCSFCLQRLEAWSDASDAFSGLALPPPPPPPPDRRPFIVFFGLVVVGVCLVVGGLGVAMLTSRQQAAESAAFQLQPASVSLVLGGREVRSLAAASPGDLVTVRFDPRNAPFAGLAVREAGEVRVLLMGEVAAGEGRVEPAVELIYDPTRHETAYVVLSGRELREHDVRTAADGHPAADVSVAVVPLR
ncbi:MAG: hypothetical protein H6736_13150 [Alphaproteobacteria bacterium]|nr:hypothetical protein [Alphaproteobacteria bacterium]